MIVYPLAEAAPRKSIAYGATLGQEHLRPLRRRLIQMAYIDMEQVIVDFSGIEATTASYVKAVVLWLFHCGQLAAGVPLEVSEGDPDRPVALEVFPFVARMGPEVEHEVEEVFTGRRLPCLEAVTWDDTGVLKARLRGAPEATARRTLQYLLEAGEATATLLHERHPAERITVTGWNNRLADLYALRLAWRTKQGRQWVYTPVVKEIRSG